MLSASDRYLNDPTSIVSGRHRTEIVCEALIREGETSLAKSLLELHREIEQFSVGKLEATKAFHDLPVVSNLVERANSTRYQNAISDILEPLHGFTATLGHLGLNGIALDWEKSSEVVRSVKAEEFPQLLTMVEMLDNSRKGKGHGRQ